MTAPKTVNTPVYPNGGDPRRRMRLHHLLVKRRRWSNELDALLGVVKPTVEASDADWCHATGLDLGYVERERAGRADGWWSA